MEKLIAGPARSTVQIVRQNPTSRHVFNHCLGGSGGTAHRTLSEAVRVHTCTEAMRNMNSSSTKKGNAVLTVCVSQNRCVVIEGRCVVIFFVHGTIADISTQLQKNQGHSCSDATDSRITLLLALGSRQTIAENQMSHGPFSSAETLPREPSGT